jgi:hypothetical protein
MSKYKAAIRKTADGDFYALVVRETSNGFGGIEDVVVGHYAGRHFKTLKAAEKSTAAYIAKASS